LPRRRVKKRVAEWGAAGLDERLAAAWRAFIARVSDAAAPWLQVVRGRGRDAVQSTYAALLDGAVAAREGHVLTV
jgi:hypothetical protein